MGNDYSLVESGDGNGWFVHVLPWRVVAYLLVCFAVCFNLKGKKRSYACHVHPINISAIETIKLNQFTLIWKKKGPNHTIIKLMTQIAQPWKSTLLNWINSNSLACYVYIVNGPFKKTVHLDQFAQLWKL